MSRPFSPRSFGPPVPSVKINGKIRAREVRVIGLDGKQQVGVMPLHDAINLAKANGVDLVEIAATATPPVCRLVDYGKYRYEVAKKEKVAKKHQHANKVKEVQLSCSIDQHDMGVKMSHAIDFLCEEMKVKVTLRFRGREMMHKELGFQVVEKFLHQLEPYGHPDASPKQVGKGVTVMISPLPRNKRAKNPNEAPGEAAGKPAPMLDRPPHEQVNKRPVGVSPNNQPSPRVDSGGFSNNPFEGLDLEPSR